MTWVFEESEGGGIFEQGRGEGHFALAGMIKGCAVASHLFCSALRT